MKKLAILALAALLVVAFTMPAAALESQFGGYWRTRVWTAQNFTGEDKTEAQDVTATDTRTRLYYTAVFHDNLKFVNKFEFDAAWGTEPLGDIGADGKELEIKNSYADFNLGPMNFKVGIQGVVLGRHFLFDDDFSGIIATYKGDNFAIPFFWVKAWEGGMGKDANDFDVDYYGLTPSFKLGDVAVNPFVLYATSDDVSGWSQISKKLAGLGVNLADLEDLSLWYAGLSLDASFDNIGVWFTGIYQGGDVDLKNSSDSADFSAYLVAAGGNVGMSWGDIHGQFFYATGDDGDDTDIDTFFVPKGQSYYWSEIMGYGTFGDTSYAQVSRNAPADQIGDIMAGNLGVTVKPMDKLKVTLDVWYAALAEDTTTLKGNKEDVLGTEVDLIITYKLLEGLNLDIVGAYLFAGDATTLEADDDANPYEVGTRLSLSF